MSYRFAFGLGWMSLALVMGAQTNQPLPRVQEPTPSTIGQPGTPAITKMCGGDPRYPTWRDEDAAYLLTQEERRNLNRLQQAEACQAFLDLFWRVRDPHPETPENEFRIEHYRRIAYANERFGSGLPGWRTDRGRIYILYGPPTEIESHPLGVHAVRSKEEGGGMTSTYPFERWIYRSIPSIGENIDIEFVDSAQTGEYKLVEVIDARRRSVLRGGMTGIR